MESEELCRLSHWRDAWPPTHEVRKLDAHRDFRIPKGLLNRFWNGCGPQTIHGLTGYGISKRLARQVFKHAEAQLSFVRMVRKSGPSLITC